jgi:two-component system response regulator DegU
MNKAITVVVVDDHPLIHQAIRSLLADRKNIQIVGEGYTGEDLFQLVEQYHPNVLILDLNMGQSQNGKGRLGTFSPLPALAWMHDKYPKTAVIILTEQLHYGIVQEAITLGVRGYVLKEDNLSLSLTEAIETVNRRVPFFSASFIEALFQPNRSLPSEELLNPRQRQIILAIAKNPDAPYKQIAGAIGISIKTMKGYLTDAYKTLDVTNRASCIIRCMEYGLIPFRVEGNRIVMGDLESEQVQ